MLLDLIIIFIITWCIYTSIKKGFVKSIFNILSTLVSVALVFMFQRPFSEFIKNSEFGKNISKSISDTLSQYMLGASQNTIEGSNMPEFLKSFMYSGAENAINSALDLSDKIMDILIWLVSFIALIIIVSIILKIVPKILDVITSVPVIKQLNKLFAVFSGVIMGVIWSVVAIYAIGTISIIPAFSFLDKHIENSFFLHILNSLEFTKFLF